MVGRLGSNRLRGTQESTEKHEERRGARRNYPGGTGWINQRRRGDEHIFVYQRDD